MSEKITTKEFASLTGISIPTLNRWAKQGKFAPAYPSEGQGKSAYYTADQMEPAKALHAKKAKPQTFSVFEESDLVNQPADNAVDLDISKNSCQCSIEGTAADVEKNSEATLGQPAPDIEKHATDASENNAVKENSEGDGVEVVAPLILTPPPVAPPSLLPAKKIFSFTEIFDVGKADAPVYTPDPHLTLDERAVVIREVGKVEALAAIIRGQELIAAKAQVGHGNWEKWLAAEFGWSDRAAQNYMQIARRFGNSKSAFLQFAKKSTLDAMLALPEGEEENFVEAQASEGRPVESQSARQIKRSVSEYKAKLQNVDAPALSCIDEKPIDAKFKLDAIKNFRIWQGFVEKFGETVEENQLNTLINLFGEYCMELGKPLTYEKNLIHIAERILACVKEICKQTADLASMIRIEAEKFDENTRADSFSEANIAPRQEKNNKGENASIAE